MKKEEPWKLKEEGEMTPEERLDALAEVLAEGFLAIAAKDPEMEWLKEPIGDASAPAAQATVKDGLTVAPSAKGNL